MYIRRQLTPLEKLCVYCNKDVNTKNDDYIATQGKDRRYRVAHRKCYNDYLEFVKNMEVKEC